MIIDIGNPQNCYECLIRNQGYSGDGMKCGKTHDTISWYDGQRKRMETCPFNKELEMQWINKGGLFCCPICGHYALLTEQNYCHYCGTDLRKDKKI